jgi:hypothetical protein
MTTNLTGSTIASTYDQLLHMDGGPEATEKSVLSGVGVATALKLGTTSASVGNMQVTNNTIASTNTNGNINITPNGTGTVVIPKVNIQSGTVVSDNVTITGGSITNVTFAGSFSGMTLVEAATLATSDVAAGVNLNGNTLAADGTDTNIDINITPKGTGEVNITNIDVLSGKVPFATITDRAFGSFSDVTDQTGSTTAPAAVKFGTNEINSNGISMVTNGSDLTRLTFATAGTYMIAFSLQLTNSVNSGHTVLVWLRENGTDMPRTATKVAIPKSSDGGSTFFNITYYEQVTAGSYIEVIWLPSNVAVTLDATAAAAGPPAVPAIPSAIIIAERIA